MNNNNFEEGNDIMFIYEWVDSVPLSRPKKNIARDFSDGVMMAEIIKHACPNLVDLHNYPAAHSTTQKLYNWNTLNQKVLKKLNFQLNKKEIEGVISCQQGVIENILKKVYDKLSKFLGKSDAAEGEYNNELEGEEAYHEENFSEHVSKSTMPHTKKKTNSMGSMGSLNSGSNEVDYKNILLQKDKMIMELKSTLEILEMKLQNSEEENRKISDRIEYMQQALRNAGKI